ncbi:two-component response regulator (plasmid) [Azospirillum sp. B510]|uniref:response regulator n=1 Tax=Azospirillum sp. (strain B510) TaxID=137722 RepID=UPI0001C4CADA|nr:response regulator [Azospirillum sp. B510]BAI75814.1 two-component response regulator [Azospirillum sp. B510]
MKILIIEDEYLIAEGVSLTLQSAGHEVTGIADDLSTAVALAGREKPDMAFVDIKLANGSSGLDVARELKMMGIPCVFATGNPPNKAQAGGLGLGYIAKPFSPRVLVQTAAFVSALLSPCAPAATAPNGFVRLQ